MKQLIILSSILFLSACGSIKGNWEGECENPSTGEVRVFNVDIDVDKRSGLEGSSFMTIYKTNGDTEIINCSVGGESSGTITLDFTCDNDQSFSLEMERDGGSLVGFCDGSTGEAELVLEQD